METTTTTPTLAFTMAECIDRCLAGFRECEVNVPRSVDKGHAVEHVRLLLDCAEICRASAGFLMRESEHHALICNVCAQLCEDCAQSCLAFHGDVDLERCADVCQTCVESCRAMASAH
ncbi:MAG: four-helix bundle copper-binding protein [Deltaproteobacteria bacterium]|nr:four-helix bundle copper-binding protein [Deltaproteobacteria bacterium]